MNITLAPDGNHFRLATSKNTTLDIPISEAGANALADLLFARQTARRVRIGEPAFPTQHQLDRWIKDAAAARLSKYGDLEINL